MWQFVFWGSLGLVAYSYFGYPLVLEFLARRRRRAQQTVASGDNLPTVTLIVSAFNEESVIRERIKNCLSLDYPRDRLDILVASDGSSDGTVDIAREYAELGVRLYHYPIRRGKSAVLNDVVPGLTTDLVVFTDANCWFAEDAVNVLAQRFVDSEIGCVVGKLRYVDVDQSSVGKGEGVYWRYEAGISMRESELRSVLVANGSIFAIRRELFRPVAAEIANDFQLPMEVANAGYGVVYEPAAQAFEGTAHRWREEFDRKVRIIIRGLTGFSRLRGLMHGFRMFQFVSHKMLRWFAGFFLVLTFVANVVLAGEAPFYAIALLGQVAFYLSAGLGWMFRNHDPVKVFYVPFYFTMVNTAAMLGTFRFAMGRRQKVWETAKSTRVSPAVPLSGALEPRRVANSSRSETTPVAKP